MTEDETAVEGEATLNAQASEDQSEQEFIESLVNDGDPDALLIADFEAAAMDTVQEDSELAVAFSANQQARHVTSLQQGQGIRFQIFWKGESLFLRVWKSEVFAGSDLE